MEKNFEIGLLKFQLRKLDAFKQFHLARRIGPILADLLPALQDISNGKKSIEGMSEEDKLDQLAKIVVPIMNGLSKLSDQEADKVLIGLLSAVEMYQSQFGSWAKIANDNSLMIQDLELPLLLQIAGRSFMYNLSGFFNAAQLK